VKTTDEAPLTVVVSRAAPRAEVAALEAAGVEVVVATGGNEPERVRSALTQLGTSGITSLMLEGGPRLAGAFLDAGEIDDLRIFIAPRLLGARGARPLLEGETRASIADALPTLALECETSGDDLLISARLREW
jgi:diaminohydroxyphosphoribosylaminopyrimidine deaminase/5-amino-6-(5-phosphoribosylamino)uracil reductase